MANAAVSNRDIVVIGGGIIGSTTAYYLTRHPSYNPEKHRIVLLEACKIAGGASGKAGGLLGLWAYPQPLARLSFGLHDELAAAHGGKNRWDYRKISCGSLEARGQQMSQRDDSEKIDSNEIGALHKRAKNGRKSSTIPADLNWVDEGTAAEYSGIGTPADTAQVHPYKFTTSMVQLAQEKGAQVLFGSVQEVQKEKGAVKSVTYVDKETNSPRTIPATDVVVAAGPWTPTILPSAPITALRAHSVTIRPSRPISAYALFTEICLPSDFGLTNNSVKAKRHHKKLVSPEIYARPNDEAYACGEGDRLIPLPKTSDEVVTDDARCQDIIDYVGSISEELRHGEVIVRQACYLPQGGPLVGETGVKGLFLASGHTCWGIQNGPGTGKLVSEFVFDGKAKSANISSLDPRKVL